MRAGGRWAGGAGSTRRSPSLALFLGEMQQHPPVGPEGGADAMQAVSAAVAVPHLQWGQPGGRGVELEEGRGSVRRCAVPVRGPRAVGHFGVDLPRASSAHNAPERDSGRGDECEGLIVMPGAASPLRGEK